MAKKIVTVVGATGKQGKGVIAAFDKGSFHIRGLTRNPDSTSAKALAAQGVEVVKADLGDVNSLRVAFAGSHIIYAMTDFYEPMERWGPEKATEIEKLQGTNMAKAANEVLTLEHYIWSTLPKDSDEFPVPHFRSKHAVDNIIESEYPALNAKTTLFVPCFYFDNLALSSYRPQWFETAKTYVQLTTYPPDTMVPGLGAPEINITPFIKAIVESPDKTQNATLVVAIAEVTTAEGWVQAWASAKGVKVRTVRVSRENFDALWPLPNWAEEFAKMFEYFEKVPLQEWSKPGKTILTKETLGVTGLQGLQAWAESWELPTI